jgi:predicted transport protein
MAETFKEPDRLQKYFASLEANIAQATGKTVAQWVKIAKTCPETKPRARLAWFKAKHGLGQNRASLILWRAFGGNALGEEDPNTLMDALFAKFAEQRPLYDKVAAFVTKLGPGTLSPRKSYVALYHLKQYGAIKPNKQGLMIGLAMQKYPKSAPLIDVKNLGGGERNKKALILASAKDFDADAKALLKAAYDEN